MRSSEDPAYALARRLRALREREWPDIKITQEQLAEALSEPQRTVSPALISSWENNHAVPPEGRLDGYATFFATRRSVERSPFRVIKRSDLTTSERARHDELLREFGELREARSAAVQADGPLAAPVIEPLGGPWAFGDARPVTLVCAELPEAQRLGLPAPDDPVRAYAELHEYADLDALFELHGHIRAANPTSYVRVRKASQLNRDHYTTHLVVLGGVDWNPATEKLLDVLDMPVTQWPGTWGSSYFEVTGEGEPRRLGARLAEDGSLTNDVGHFFRALNPFNEKRTVTICNALSGRGVLGTVRSLTDERFRDRNAGHLREQLSHATAYSLLMRIQILGGDVITPDWTRSSTRLHEWRGDA